MKRVWLLAAVFIFFAASMPALADDVTDAIGEALNQYKQGDYTGAAGTLDFAAQLIRQKKGGELEQALPGPLPGWQAEEASSQAASHAFLGGAVSAARSYTKNVENDEGYYETPSVTVQIVTDSPALQGMMMLMSNPMFATADGGKLEQISGQRAVVKYNNADRSGEISMVVNNRFLVTVEGSYVTRDELKAYAGAVDFKKLTAIP
jgi:uncharacterized protein YdeI (BOF family)